MADRGTTDPPPAANTGTDRRRGLFIGPHLTGLGAPFIGELCGWVECPALQQGGRFRDLETDPLAQMVTFTHGSPTLRSMWSSCSASWVSVHPVTRYDVLNAYRKTMALCRVVLRRAMGAPTRTLIVRLHLVSLVHRAAAVARTGA